MPILKLPGPEALHIRKANKLAFWPKRTQENRVEPVARPGFDTPFRLESSEPIFTIGSCFARNVETELLRRGFVVPMTDLFYEGPFKGLNHEIVNNFGTPSIYNEIGWAFGDIPFREEDAFMEMSNGKFVDLHMINGLRPAPLEVIRKRREALLAATRVLAKCRVLIVTLGLVELWWDEQAGSYLNTAPMPSVLKRFPERFELHVLGFEDSYRFLRQAFDIAFAHGRKDLRIVLTVSPVPMQVTHRREDVMVANSYSKSVLRAVAEHITVEDDRIVYFPSFESVTITNRKVAWLEDQVHVSSELVAFNVERMVNGFMGLSDDIDEKLPDAFAVDEEDGEWLILAEKARQARGRSDAKFFEQHEDVIEKSAQFTLEYAKFLIDRGRIDEALELLDRDDRGEARLIRARLRLENKDFEAGLADVMPLCKRGIRGRHAWMLALQLLGNLKDVERIQMLEQRWLDARPNEHTAVLCYTGRALARAGDKAGALDRFERVLDDSDVPEFAQIEAAMIYNTMNQYDRTLEVLANTTGATDWQIKQITKLRTQAQAALVG